MPFVGSHGAYYRFSRLALSRLPRFDLTGLRLCLELPPVEPPAERIGAFGAFVRVEGLDPCGPSAYSEFREAIAPILSSSPIAMILSKPDSAVATTSLAVSKAMRSDDVRRPLPATEREPPPRGAPDHTPVARTGLAWEMWPMDLGGVMGGGILATESL